MTYMSRIAGQFESKPSPLMLSDRLLRLAEDADRGGFRVAAEHLLHMAVQMLDDPQSLTA